MGVDCDDEIRVAPHPGRFLAWQARHQLHDVAGLVAHQHEQLGQVLVVRGHEQPKRRVVSVAAAEGGVDGVTVVDWEM